MGYAPLLISKKQCLLRSLPPFLMEDRLSESSFVYTLSGVVARSMINSIGFDCFHCCFLVENVK